MRNTYRVLGLVGCVLAAMAPAQAQDYPTQTITIVVPYAPGGSTDMIARIVGDELRKSLGQSVIVENKPGAYGIIALEHLAASRPDGYTLMLGNVTTNAITPQLYPDRLSFTYDEAITPVSRIAYSASFLLASVNNFEPSSVEELVGYGKENAGDIRYSSAGVGSFPHFDALMLFDKADVEATHIPSKEGAAGMLNALINGDANIGFIDIASSIGLVNEGKLRALAVITEERMPQFPDVPTLSELGFPGIGTFNWQALFAPAGTPDEILTKLSEAVNAALATETVEAAFAKSLIVTDMTEGPDDATAWLAEESAKWKQIVQDYPVQE